MLTILYFISFLILPLSEPIVLHEANVEVTIPNKEWHYNGKSENGKYTIFSWQRTPLVDNMGRSVISGITIMVEHLEIEMDIIAYSVNKRSERPIKILGMITPEDDFIDYNNLVGYETNFVDEYGVVHFIYDIHALNGNKGIQIICETSRDVIEDVIPEFKSFLKSLKKR